MKRALSAIIALSTLFIGGCSLQQIPQTTSTPADTKPASNVAQDNALPPNTTLDLSNKNLEKIPQYVFGLKNVDELNVSGNKLTGAIPAEIRNLQSLKILNASNNQMTGVPAEIGQLRNLEVLDLSNNQLTGLPYELGNLQQLKVLNISGNNYAEVDLSIIKQQWHQNVTVIK